MRKSLLHWLRKLVLMGIASAGFTICNNSYAHDLPIFDSLTPMNCFGIGSCGFPIDSGNSQFTLRPELESPASAAGADGSQFDWSWAECFSGPSSTLLGQTPWPQINSAATCPSEAAADETVVAMEDAAEEAAATEADFANATPDNPTYAADYAEPSWSYPVSSLSLIQAIGIQIPKFDLDETLKLFPQAIRNLYEGPASSSELVDEAKGNEQSYLVARPLVDDYLADESFVRDWRTHQSYRGLNRLDYIESQSGSESLAVAVPNLPQIDAAPWIASLVDSIGDIQCRVSQEMHDHLLTGRYSRQLGKSLANLEWNSFKSIDNSLHDFSSWAFQPATIGQPEFVQLQQDMLFGQPAFVIYQVEGKDFLLPAKQARHWNSVPNVPSPSGFNAEAGSSTDLIAAKSMLVSELANSASKGLELAAAQLQRLAGHLRAVARVESQVANRSEADGIR